MHLGERGAGKELRGRKGSYSERGATGEPEGSSYAWLSACGDEGRCGVLCTDAAAADRLLVHSTTGAAQPAARTPAPTPAVHVPPTPYLHNNSPNVPFQPATTEHVFPGYPGNHPRRAHKTQPPTSHLSPFLESPLPPQPPSPPPSPLPPHPPHVSPWRVVPLHRLCLDVVHTGGTGAVGGHPGPLGPLAPCLPPS